MGLLKKLTKPLSKVLDKIVPNEIKPALPYLAAFAPFYMPPGMQFAQSGIFSNPMFTRALMSGAANLGSQLSQEGSEGDFNPFSVAMASGVGALGAQNAPEFFQGMQRGPTGVDKFGPIEVPYSDTGIMASVSDAIGKGGASAAKFIGEAGKVLRPGGKEVGLNLPTLEAASIPISQGTGDLALADAQLALRDYENEMANQDQLSLIDDDGRRRAIRAAMERAGHLEEIIVDTLAELGLKDGGVVKLKQGGRIGFKEGSKEKESSKEKGVGSILTDFLASIGWEGTAEDLRQEREMGWYLFPELADVFYPKHIYGGDKEKLGRYKKHMKGTHTGSHPQEEAWKKYKKWMTMENYERANKAEGGVASVLPKGREADYRGGGVIPVGSRERADDVPARLSKNEFVMTADAVRAAGGGSINKGAKRMYNLMNNLEARV